MRCNAIGNKFRAQADTFDQQCFCEEKPPKEVYKCGDDGENCACKGINIYARKTDDSGEELSFEEIYESGDFEMKRSNRGTSCDANTYDKNRDFFPGVQKQCFCDSKGLHHINHYRRKRTERINRQKIARARQQEEELERQRRERERLESIRLAKIEADAKAAEAAAEAAAAAAKVAEEAAFAKAEQDRIASEKVAAAAKLKADGVAHLEEAEA